MTESQFARTLVLLKYGPDNRREIPEGTLVRLRMSPDLPQRAYFKDPPRGGYWIEPVNTKDVAPEVLTWARSVGCYASAPDLNLDPFEGAEAFKVVEEAQNVLRSIDGEMRG